LRGNDGHRITDFTRRVGSPSAVAPVTCAVLTHKPTRMDLDDWNSPTTKLLTLLNVSAAKSLKRKVLDQGSPTQKQKLNKRRVEIISPDSAVQVKDDAEATVPETREVGQGDSPGDVEISEPADLSDTEGVLQSFC
jgi:hypothetical protein